MKILVIQLARMGDILQTTAALHGLRQKYPASRIDVLVRKSFSDVLAGNPYINNVVVLDSLHILENLLNRKGSLVESSSRLKELVAALEAEKYDTVYNLTFSLASSYITWLVGGKDVYGLSRSNDGYYTAADEWSKYFVANILNEGMNRKHIVDIFRNICGVQDKKSSLYMHMPLASKQWFASQLSSLGLSEQAGVVSIQPGASRMSKRWDADNFVLLIKKLLVFDPSLVFCVVGSSSEQKLCSSIVEKTGSKNIFSLAGKTNLRELAAVLSSSKLLISNDTGTLHLATAFEVPSICISVGPSSVYESGPYSFAPNYTLTPKLSCYPCDYQTKCGFNKCKTLVPVDAVLNLSMSVLSGTAPVPGAVMGGADAQFDVYSGNITSSKTENNQPYSEIRYSSIGGRTAGTEEIMASVYGSLWNYIFNGYDERILSFDTFPSPETLKQLDAAAELLDKLQHLAEIGIRYSDILLKELESDEISLDNVKGTGNKMVVVDDNILALGSVSSSLLPLINMFKVDKECLKTGDVKELTEQTRQNYTKLRVGSNYVSRMLRQVTGSSVVADIPEAQSLTEKEAGYVK